MADDNNLRNQLEDDLLGSSITIEDLTNMKTDIQEMKANIA